MKIAYYIFLQKVSQFFMGYAFDIIFYHLLAYYDRSVSFWNYAWKNALALQGDPGHIEQFADLCTEAAFRSPIAGFLAESLWKHFVLSYVASSKYLRYPGYLCWKRQASSPSGYELHIRLYRRRQDPEERI